LTIYSKSEQVDIAADDIKEIIAQYEQQLPVVGMDEE
jgi:hypothetical protein